MTELERELTAALEMLSGQFETAQQQHSEQVDVLQQRFEQQAAENRTLRLQIEPPLGTAEMHGRGLQDARRDVARAVELMRQHGRQPMPERDHGPSR